MPLPAWFKKKNSSLVEKYEDRILKFASYSTFLKDCHQAYNIPKMALLSMRCYFVMGIHLLISDDRVDIFSDPLNNLKHYYQYLPPPDDLWSVFWVAIDTSKFKPKVLGWQGWSLSYRDLVKISFLLFWIMMIWDRPRTY